MFMATLAGAFALALAIAIYGGIIYIAFLIIKALRTYIKVNEGSAQSISMRKPLGESIKEHRNACGMTQDFVAAVSAGISEGCFVIPEFFGSRRSRPPLPA